MQVFKSAASFLKERSIVEVINPCICSLTI